MVPLRRLCVLVLVVVAVAAACGSGGGPKTVSSSAALQRTLDAGGVRCDGYEPASATEKQKYVNDQAYCQILGDSSILYVFKTQSDLNNWVTRGIEVGCAYGSAVVTFDEGPNWVVQTETPAVTKAIRSRLGGSAVIHQC